MKRFLVVWLIVAVVFVGFVANSWEREKESIYSIYLPPLSTVPTRAEQQDLTFRWFHRLDVKEVKRGDFERFKALNLLYYDYEVMAVGRNLSFNVDYLGLADDGKVYHATTGDGWLAPYCVTSYTLEDDQLHLRLKRDDSRVFFLLGLIAVVGSIPAMFIEGILQKWRP